MIEELSPDPVDIFSLPVSMHDEQKISETYLLQDSGGHLAALFGPRLQ